MLTEVSKVAFNKAGRGFGEDYLAPVRCGADAGRTVNIDAYIPLMGQLRLPCVETHANPQLAAGQDRLPLPGGGDSPRRCGEGVEERVSLRVDFDSRVPLESVAEQPAMLEQRVAVAITELLEEAR
jgi:hypothetical protein